MPKNRPSLLTLLILGLAGSGSAWTAPDATSADAAPAAAPITSTKDLRARFVELRARQQEAPDDPGIAYEIGAFYLDQGDPKAAAEQLQRAIDGAVEAPDAWLLLGRAWLLQGRLAEIQTRIPIDEIGDPQIQAEVRVLQGLAWLDKQRPGEARESFKDALTRAPDLSSAYLGLARLSLAEGNVGAARDALTSAAQGVRPDPAGIADLRGELALANKDNAAAEAAFQAALNARPDQTWRRRSLAHVQLNQGKVDAADANIATILAASPRDPAALYLSAYSAYLRKDYQRAYDTLSPMLQGQVEEPGALFIAGASAYQLGHDNQAVELLTLLLARRPQDLTARPMLAASQLRLGDAAAALATMKPLLDAPHPDAGILTLAGQAALLAGDGRAAVTYLEAAAAQKPKAEDIGRLLSAARIAAGDRAAGIAELRRLVSEGGEGAEDLELALLRESLKAGDWTGLAAAATRYRDRHKNQPEGHLLAGIAQARTGALDAARKSFEQVLSLNPKDADALVGLAEVNLRQGNTSAAETAIGQALALRASDPRLLQNYAKIALAVGKPDQAITRLQQALQADPKDPRLLTILAALYTDAGRPLEALRLLTDQGDEKAPAVLAERARAALRAGRPESAIADARARAALEPQAANAQLELGRALEQANQLTQARAAFSKAQSLQPDNADAAIALERMDLLTLKPPVSGPAANAALERISATLKQHPSGADATRLRATVAVLTGNPDLAQRLLEPLYAAQPDADTAIELAFARVQAKDPKGGIAVLQRHLNRYPKDLKVRLMLARFLAADQQTGAATTQFTTLLEQDWTNIDAHLDLAALLIQAGRAPAAKPHLAEALKARPADERAKALQAAANGRSGTDGK